MLSLFRRLNAGEAVFDFIGHRKRWYWISAVLLLLSITSFVVRGFNFGIEFDGGTQFQFKATTAQPADVQQVAEQAGADVQNAPQIVGTGANRSIIVKAGELYTPDLSTSILPGITRDTVIQIAQDLGYQVHEKPLIRSDLYLSDEAFMTGTAAEVTPLRSVDDVEIGVGPITLEIQAAYLDTARGRSERWAQWLEYATPTPAEA